MSERQQIKKLDEILDRLSQYTWTNRDLLNEAVIKAKEKWSMPEVIAYFDLLDLEDRT